MSSPISRTLIVIVTSAAMITAGYFWWTRDERAIRARMTAVARVLTITPPEPDMDRVRRVATLRHALAPEIGISVPVLPAAHVAAREQTISRDAALALAVQWVPPPGGVIVEFVGMRVIVGNGRSTAVVRSTLHVTTEDSSGQPLIEASDLTAGFTRVDGTWLVASVQLREQF